MNSLFVLLGSATPLQTVTEIVGWIGSIGVAVSLMMSNVFRLRVINFVGAAMFAVYGFMVGAVPVGIINGFIALTDIYYLIVMYRDKEYFSTLEVRTDSNFMRHFIEYWKADIERFAPEFSWKKMKDPKSVFVLRNLQPVGLFIYQQKTKKQLEIKLDYVRPEYRDMKSADFLYSSYVEKLREQGYQEFVVSATSPKHRQYLLRMGFTPHPKKEDMLVKSI